MSIHVRLLWLVLMLCVTAALYWHSFASMVAIWERSETFAHGFIVLPVAAYLIWRKRDGLSHRVYEVDWRAAPLIVLASVAWLLARLTDVLVIEQLASVAMIPLSVWLVLGLGTLRYLAFPLGFLLFAVPVGEGLVYPLMQFTAEFTVGLLRLTGIPVFWEGTSFSLPTGDWQVVEACSGIRYLIASIFLGVLYAYLTYHSIWRRLAFIALSVVVPIIANGLRAYLIVMLGHLSGMKLATGIDHIIYGWVFFGLVMFLLFSIGRLWVDRDTAVSDSSPSSDMPRAIQVSSRREFSTAVVGLLLLVSGPLVNASFEAHRLNVSSLPVFEMPLGRAGWSATDQPLSDWVPHYMAPSAESRQVFVRQDHRVGVHIAFYGGADSGELVNSQNVLAPQKETPWKLIDPRPLGIRVDGKSLQVTETRLSRSGQTLLVWSWYWINGYQTANPYVAKVYEALALLLDGRLNEAAVFLYTEVGSTIEPAAETLAGFSSDMLPSLSSALSRREQQALGDSN